MRRDIERDKKRDLCDEQRDRENALPKINMWQLM